MKGTPVNLSDSPWRAPPETVALDGDEVHVWQAALDRTPSQIQRFHQDLSVDEQARAERFYFEKDRAHFIVARGVLRAILGAYLGRAPEQLRFCYDSHGKPALTGEADREAVRFNVSHSGRIALYAVTRDREVGIDLERIRFDLAVAELAGRFFSRREIVALGSLPTDMQRQAFFRCWTRKEAYIKARGLGLSLPLSEFDVSLAPGEPAAILCTRPDASEASRWSLQELTPAPGYAAAIAVEGHGWRLVCWQWPGSKEQSV
jgi:4'-phosphopantetheinyl transferase